MRHRRRWLVLAAVLVVLGAWLGWCVAVVSTPRVDRPAAVDAVLVLGGLDGPERTETALAMVDAGLTHTVVLSMPSGTEDELAQATCAHPPSGVDVVCFRPDPSTTQGEARELRSLAGSRHWQRVAVVTSTYHVSRARLIVSRCFGGELLLVDSHEHISLAWWAYQYAYQSGAYVKAELSRSC